MSANVCTTCAPVSGAPVCAAAVLAGTSAEAALMGMFANVCTTCAPVSVAAAASEGTSAEDALQGMTAKGVWGRLSGPSPREVWGA
eukprot:scaffold46601_cov23-Tisochrysis_lutea.AAC.2